MWCVVKTLISTNTLVGQTLALVVLATYEATKLTLSRGQSVECWYYVETEAYEK